MRTRPPLIAAHVLCSVFAGLAGLLLASRLGVGSPTVGQQGGYALLSIAAVVLGGTLLIGGRGSIWGTIGGVAIFAVVDNVMSVMQVNPFLKDVVRGVVIVAAVAVYSRRAIVRRRARFGPGRHENGRGCRGRGRGARHGRGIPRPRERRPVQPTDSPPDDGRRHAMNFLRTLVSPRGAVFLLLVVLLVAVIVLNPNFAEPGQIMRYIQRVAPVAIVAIGQYFVIVAGEFDLSQGSLITAQVIIAGNLVGEDDSRTIPVLLLMIVFGLFVGLHQRPAHDAAQGAVVHRDPRDDARPPGAGAVVDRRRGDGQPGRQLPRDRPRRHPRHPRSSTSCRGRC